MRLRAASALALALALACAAEAAAAPPIPVKAQSVGKEANIADIAHTYGATVADFNGDGTDDAFLNYHYERFPRLMLNDGGGVFEDVTRASFGEPLRKRDYHYCPAADVDGNGRLDIYCTHGGGKGGTGAHPNELWLQDEEGVFTEHSGPMRVGDPYGRGRSGTFIDANGDPWPDLYITNAYPRRDGRRGPNRLFINFNGMAFRDAPEFGLHGRLGGTFAQAIDYDRDGYEDLLVCGQRGLVVYRNIRGRRFNDVTAKIGAGGACLDAELAYVNRDRRPDLVRLTRRGLRVSLQRADKRLQPRPVLRRKVRGARRIATGDVNSDRIGDIYVLRAGPRAQEQGDPYAETGGDRKDLMLVSRGKPGSLRGHRIPQTTLGVGESVTAIDHDENGLTDFIVMNGLHKAVGPIRLVAFYPR